MARPLKRMARFFKRNVEARFNSLLDSSTQCGAIVDIDRQFDIDFVDTLDSFGVSVPKPVPGEAVLPSLSRSRSVKLKGNVAEQLPTSVPINAKVLAAVKASSAVSMSFNNVTTQKIKRFELEKAIRKVLDEKSSDAEALDAYLDDNDNHIVVQTYQGNLNIHFEGAGGAEIDVEAEVPDVASLSAGVDWEWSHKGVLTSKTPVIFAFETCRWRNRAQRLKETS